MNRRRASKNENKGTHDVAVLCLVCQGSPGRYAGSCPTRYCANDLGVSHFEGLAKNSCSETIGEDGK